MNPFQNPILRDTFFAYRNTEQTAMDMGILAFEGDGPFEEKDFFSFLLNQGCAAIPMMYWTMEITNHMSREETLEYCLEEIYPLRKDEFLQVYNKIHAANPQVSPVFSHSFDDAYALYTQEEQIRRYSQEMILIWLGTGLNPYEQDPRALAELLKHPALGYQDPAAFEELLKRLGLAIPAEEDLHWPSTNAKAANPHKGIAFEAEDHGLLSHFGYRVGKKAPTLIKRREALEKAISQPLLAQFPQSYIQDCGEPNSTKRIQKIITALTAFIRNGKRKGPSHQQAVAHWEEDLDWLQQKFG